MFDTNNSNADVSALEKRTIHYSRDVQRGDKRQQANFEGFFVQPASDTQRGSVIVVHEIFGVTDHIKDVACRYAQHGYTVLAPNLFTREDEPPPLSGGFEPLRAFVSNIPDAQIMGDLDGAMDYLRAFETSNGKVGIVGFCWGGRVSMLYDAHAPTLNAAIAYYGRIVGPTSANPPQHPLDVVAQMQAPLLGHFGAEDASIPPAHAAQLRDALSAAQKTAEIYVYAQAGHAFNNDTREAYNPEAAQLALQRSLDWFDTYLKSEPA